VTYEPPLAETESLATIANHWLATFEKAPSLCITHAPGHMLVTDLMNASLVSP